MPRLTEERESGLPGPVQYPEIDSSKDHLRNYQMFPGHATFYVKGHFQSAGKRPYLVFVFAAIAVPAGLFFGFTAPWIWNNVSQSLPIVFSYILLLCVMSLVRSAGSDPGILPRNIHIETSDAEKRDQGPLNIAPLSVTVNCRQYDEDHPLYLPINYCTVCRIWRPARAIHCRDCDSCIDFMDHHCVWLNNCIGARNYRYFFCFILSLCLLAYFMATLCFLHVFAWRDRKSSTTIAAVRFAPVSFALAIYAVIGSIYPTALGLYHIFLISRGENTREFSPCQQIGKKETV
ncbi:DHHC palmitoyltransferase-domain-containing protein [Lipomyces doorenjongii]|uniref:DHHC palmitoyltransferase-domain-containing protein n=1 Tax=Lipomyces doorenjongii TaxID=383834 RepID=UPI0034CFDFF0